MERNSETRERYDTHKHTCHVRLGQDSNAADRYRTKVPWTWFDTTTVRLVLRSLGAQVVHLKIDHGTQLLPWTSVACDETDTQRVSENWSREVTGKPQSKTSYLEDPGSIEDHPYWFMVDKIDLGKTFLPVLRLSTLSIISRVLHIHISFFPHNNAPSQ